MTIDGKVVGPPTRRCKTRKRVEARRDLASHLAVYVVVNASLIGLWAMTGGYFWPAWVLGLWGAGLLLHAWDVLWRQRVVDSQVRRPLP